jgi:hypothetical protein
MRCTGEKCIRVLVGKAQGKGLILIARCRWVCNAKMSLKGVRSVGVHWGWAIVAAVVWTVTELRAPEIGEYKYIDCPRNCVISGLRCELRENCALLGCYAAGGGNSLQTFQDNLLVPSSNGKNSWSWRCHYLLRTSPDERSSYPGTVIFSSGTC